MSRAVLSIGSNLGDRLGYLRSVIEGFGPRVVAVSPVFSTAPWGGVEQDDFLNSIVVVEDPDFECIDWLRRGQELERAADRVREVRWGARTLDVDVIWCSDDGLRPCRSEDPELTLPHPQAHRRAFVLVPWLEVEPDAELEVDGRIRRVRDLLAELDAAERDGVHRTTLTLTRGGADQCSS
ncbi:2-amino-4-hydroxy-6-hydroxymethyldihydropteridine diphosphokinase [Nocardia cyriacigeorgica]|uniref:2-amino-4-hydroxy-6-hydroxymethyldihydropteridine diphosphokinase n=2 Tax=Nocardia cyriacigeorgica TaxID=135487 RepID=H6RAZ1_NOCCG|nr:2-amino-4-hydroxy-6-hydroxymethyldihydropteridine diphosphokinase [Nocardia cyriacigeorgica]MBF6285363.1 2-amino-4-hydroxy-6-hydroxymethyldihydropteridine diphosphokinase [Nocardia cyriacigeorgica]MBF6424719.1 2-amino-4-hydroxy-6-hydroxymethyldihydropteridine diphosphokinase [Nocardia cyriacigeorgica]NEW35335.1 2-amino-4-hydroxy-6-hydroxymethyldihydropteridine diphosphokinase [Nocardia cyriacigeorgica]CCF61230.1 2-amino-4-hydroxy-6-hydroxymethyldihydropteridinepyrophosphokinase [Nocardia cyr